MHLSYVLLSLLVVGGLSDEGDEASLLQSFRSTSVGGKKSCRAVSSRASHAWCNANCNHNPPYCPRSFCACSSPDPSESEAALLPHVGLGNAGESCDKVCEDFGGCDPSLETKMHEYGRHGAQAFMKGMAAKFNRVCRYTHTRHSHGNSPYTHRTGTWCSAGDGRNFDCARSHKADQRYCLCNNQWATTTTTTRPPLKFESFADKLAKGQAGQSCESVCQSHNANCDAEFVTKIYATGDVTSTMKKIAAKFGRQCNYVAKNHRHTNSPYTHTTSGYRGGTWCSAGKPPNFQCRTSHPRDERYCLCTGAITPPKPFAAFDKLALGDLGESCSEACQGAGGCDETFESQIAKTSKTEETMRAIAKHFGRECKTVRGNHRHHNSPYTHSPQGYQKGTWCSVGDGTSHNCFRKHRNDMRYCMCNNPWVKPTTSTTTAITGTASEKPVQLAAGGQYCLVAGDPHIKTFDSKDEDQMCLGPMGDFWLVNTAKLKIQARYLGRERGDGYSWVKGLVIAGSLLGAGNPKIHIPIVNSGVIEYEVGGTRVPMIVNKQQTSYNNGQFTIERKAGPKLAAFMENPDPNDKSRQDSLFIKFHAEDVLIIINEGTIQHVLISATQSAVAGSTGQCGNFNGDPKDDIMSVDACSGRAKECLFPAELCPNPEDGKPRVPKNCSPEQSDFYHKICVSAHKNPKPWTIFNCKVDCCATRSSCPDMDNEGMTATCILRGDPHIKVFDSDKSNKHVYGPLGDYWLVRNKYLQIQARYKSNRNDQRAQVMGVAISGPMMGPKPYPVLYIPTEGGNVTEYVNGDPDDMILCTKNCAVPSSTFTKGDYYNLTYGDGIYVARYFDNVNKKRRNSYTLNIFDRKSNPKIVIASITINQGHIQAVKITAEEWLLHNVNGQCGNFNGDQTDDYSGSLADLVVNSNFFPTTNDQAGDQVASVNCAQNKYDEAIKKCKDYHKHYTNNDVIFNCALDCCTGTCEIDGHA